MDLLRFITCGSVDDGKSTLIGRLLYDSDSVSLDVLATLEKRRHAGGAVDLALLTDGLKAEREQGITIDVAHKYFTTPRRKFIITDAPGHVQYTRNMVTGASNADLAIVLVDARQGIIEQTRRHTLIASLLGIQHFVLAVNKMDLVSHEEAVFNQIVEDYHAVAEQLKLASVVAIPLSALNGDNVVRRSRQLGWYEGPSLLEHLEQVPVPADANPNEPRFQVQYVIRPQTEELHDYRGYAGRIQSGTYRPGDRVRVWPSGLETEIEAIEINEREVAAATAPQAVVLRLRDDVDVSRGDTIVPVNAHPAVTREVEATLCWMDERPLKAGRKLLVQHHTAVVKASVTAIVYKTNVATFESVGTDAAQLNDIVRVQLKTAGPLVVDDYRQNRATGAFILVDEQTGATLAAGLIEGTERDYFTPPVLAEASFSI
ncbi:GTP-binding protein [Hymenobacter sp. BT770]|uniref:sulfate adenylyltransferase subunit 1 n=1 Tax=Hymenobacter sp. BT770 TaxID=2886942 RepID=UPI001D0F9F41|nr:GTP-binding protein [Hymenobacter sp. BT770]MCC3153573.1 50S ribosome-binding GTPase [Hymenobacter sp. BT770]MDO3415809.1 GTP-binding protein [Hymenobacter sp. BT770]